MESYTRSELEAFLIGQHVFVKTFPYTQSELEAFLIWQQVFVKTFPICWIFATICLASCEFF